MQHMFRVCFAIFLVTIGQHLYAQAPLRFQTVAGVNGISLGKINAITQDKYGYLWLSDQTNRCIIRYDGSKMVRYQNKPFDTNSLGGNYPECFFADTTGNLWIGFFGMGMDKFNPHTNTFTHYRHNNANPNSLSNDSVTAILQDKEGKIWVGTNQGLNLLNEKTGQFTRYKNDPKDPGSLSWNIVRSLLLDKNGDLWIGTGSIWLDKGNGGLNRYNQSTNNFTRFVHDPADPGSISENSVRSLLEDSYGNFWVGTGGDGIQLLDRKTGRFTRYPYNPQHPELLSRSKPRSAVDNITFIVEDAARQIWFGTHLGGMVRYDPASGKVQRFDGEFVSGSPVRDSTSWAAHALSDGTVWISTEMSNLYKIDVRENKLPFYAQTSLRYRGTLKEKNNWWLSTENGVVRRELRTGQSHEYKVNASSSRGISGLVTSFHRDRSGRLWMATKNGLDLYDDATDTFIRTLLDSVPSQRQPNCINLYEDSHGRLWISTWNGVYLMDEERKKVRHFLPDPSNENSLSGNIPLQVIELNSQEFIISVFNTGFNKFNLERDTWTRYQAGLAGSVMARDKSGTIWAGSGAGIYRFDSSVNNFISLSSEGRISNEDEVMSMIIDKNDNIWYATATKLYRINAERDMISEFGSYYVASGVEFTYGSGGMVDDKLFFGSTGGYYLFNPDSVAGMESPSKVLLSGFSINNKPYFVSSDGPMKEPIQTSSGITLNHDQNTFSFTVSVINFRTIENNFRYQLAPYDGQWRNANSEEPVQYYNIPPGKYVVKVRTQGMDGKWNTLEMNLVINPPWWRSPWAYGIYAILGLFMLFGLDRFQRSRIRAQERLRNSERELEHAREIEKAYHQLKSTQAQLIQSEKMASLGELTAGIAHEIQNPLNFVNNFAEVNTELGAEMREALAKGDGADAEGILKMMTDNEQKILHHGKRADAIVKSMLQHSRSSFGVKELTDINALADEYLRLSYHGIRAKDKSFQADYSFTPDLAIGKVNVVPQDIGRVLLNLINNAFYAVKEKAKDAAPGYKPMVTVSTRLLTKQKNESISQLANELIISVQDNGFGIPEINRNKIFQPFFTTKPTGEGTGLGLSLSYDIVKAHGGEIKVESKEREGTVFTVSLPIG